MRVESHGGINDFIRRGTVTKPSILALSPHVLLSVMMQKEWLYKEPAPYSWTSQLPELWVK